jgi:Tfp pilus assembly protein PilE
MKQRQRGMTFIGLLFVGSMVAFFGIVAVQVVPTYIEYITIVKAVKKAANGASTVQDVRNSFDKSTSIDQISSITGKDLEVTKQNDQVVVSFAYQREIHLGGPAYLVMKYQGSSR